MISWYHDIPDPLVNRQECTLIFFFSLHTSAPGRFYSYLIHQIISGFWRQTSRCFCVLGWPDKMDWVKGKWDGVALHHSSPLDASPVCSALHQQPKWSHHTAGSTLCTAVEQFIMGGWIKIQGADVIGAGLSYLESYSGRHLSQLVFRNASLLIFQLFCI